jgi:hypothetical protein
MQFTSEGIFKHLQVVYVSFNLLIFLLIYINLYRSTLLRHTTTLNLIAKDSSSTTVQAPALRSVNGGVNEPVDEYTTVGRGGRVMQFTSEGIFKHLQVMYVSFYLLIFLLLVIYINLYRSTLLQHTTTWRGTGYGQRHDTSSGWTLWHDALPKRRMSLFYLFNLFTDIHIYIGLLLLWTLRHYDTTTGRGMASNTLWQWNGVSSHWAQTTCHVVWASSSYYYFV